MSTYRLTISAAPASVERLAVWMGKDAERDGLTFTLSGIAEDDMQNVLHATSALLRRGYIVSPPCVERLTKNDAERVHELEQTLAAIAEEASLALEQARISPYTEDQAVLCGDALRAILTYCQERTHS